MKKALFTFVGLQDPVSEKTDEEGSIITLCRHIKPDIVYMFPTAKGLGVKSDTEECARDTKDWIKDEISKETEVFIIPVRIDPTNYTQILDKAKEEILTSYEDVRNNYSDIELHANCSSGTPQQKACWLVLANAGLLPSIRLWQVGNPEYKEERVEEINIYFLEETNIISRARISVGRNMFFTAAEDMKRLSKISSSSGRRNNARLLAGIFQAYERWDHIQYKEAYDKLSSALSTVRGCFDLSGQLEILEKQLDTLKLLKSGNNLESSYNIVDLYFNTVRRFDNGQYTEVLARFWRLYEGILYYRLREKHNIEPTDLRKSKGNVGKIEEYYKANVKELKSINLSKTDAVLAKVFRDKEYIDFTEDSAIYYHDERQDNINIGKTLDELRRKRNDSIVAHGMIPINRSDAEKSLLVLKRMLDFIGFSYEAYSFNAENNEKLLEILY